MRRSRSVESGGGRPSLATRVKSNIPASNAPSGRSSLVTSGGNSRSRSSSAGRQSFSKGSLGGVGKQRSSGYGRTFGTETLKERRPLSNRSYKDRSIKKLVDFLTMRHYPNNVSPRSLQSPQTKDVLRIFEFVYSFIQPGYKLSGKVEEEIPKIMKMLEYPFTLTKQMMFTIGAPHTWPHVLGALHWLVEYIEAAFNTDVMTMIFPRNVEENFDAESENEILLNYYSRSYAIFMSGGDSFDDVEEDLISRLKTRNIGHAGSVEQLEDTHRRLMMEFDDLQREPDHQLSVQEDNHKLNRDLSKFLEYLERMEALRVKLAKAFDEKEEDFNNIELECQRISQDVKHNRHVFETQNISQSDVQRIKMGSQELRRQNDALRREIEENEKQIWTFEMGMGKKQAKIESNCQQHNQLLMKLQMILPGTSNVFSIDTNEMKCEPNGDCGQVKERLKKCKELSETRAHELLARYHHEQELLEQVKERKEDIQSQMEKSESKLVTLGSELDQQKEAMMKEENQIKAKISVNHEQCSEMKQLLLMNDEHAISIRYTEPRKKLEKAMEDAKRDKAEWMYILRTVIDQVVNHKETLQNHFVQFAETMEEMYEEEKKELEEMTKDINRPI